MRNKISQNLKLSNKLILSNKVLLSLHLLEQNVMNLEDEIMEIVEENPFLEIDVQPISDPYKRVKKSDGTDDFIENVGMRVNTLRSHLIEQIYALDVDQELEHIMMTLLDLLDLHGFLTVELEEIARDLKVSKWKVERAIRILKSLDPPGVGSADVKEALEIQAEDPTVKILIDHLEDLQGKRGVLMKELNLSNTEFEEAFQKLRSLNPYPANGFADSSYTRYVEPDILVFESDEGYIVTVNEIFEVKFTSKNLYEKLMESKDESNKKFAKQLYDRAFALVEALNRRKETLVKIGKILVKHEINFLRGGEIVPLRISEIANEIGLSLSTVARAVSTKYIKTPRGVHSLKAFFSRAVYLSDNGKISRDQIKEKIKELIMKENKAKPFTDSQITKELKNEGIKISRRVVSKYREELMIPSSNRRRVR